MPVLVTAFSPFGDREENASSLVLRELLRRKIGIRYRILPVDSVIAPSRLKTAIRHIRPKVVIMLGEAAGCNGIRLETTAWNSKEFRIPDTAGRMPNGLPVIHRAAASMPSTLPLQEFRKILLGNGHPVSLSDDPGRYLCNQIFFSALDFLYRNDADILAGFIHLPLESEFPTSSAADAMERIIEAC